MRVDLPLVARSVGVGLPLLLSAAALTVGCSGGSPEVPPGAFQFAVLGDAPYGPIEGVRFRRVMRQIHEADLSMVIHVGDIFWYPCSDEHYESSLAAFNAQRHPLVYTPGDNEWTDCHQSLPGAYAPLERLSTLRRIFFQNPASSLGGRKIPVVSQSADSAWAEFVENARWTEAGFVFATLHLVGSENGMEDFAARTDDSDAESIRRTAAATSWLQSTFALADSGDARGIVIALHAEPGFTDPADNAYRQAFEPFLETLERAVAAYAGPVLLVHGDNHEYTIDHPVVDRRSGRVLDNLTRLQVMGSPDVGWVAVTVDPAAADPFSFSTHQVPRWMIW